GELRLAIGELQNQGVGAGAAVVFVVRTDVLEAGAEVAGHAVDQHVVVGAGEQLVAAGTAVEEVVALAAGMLVVAGGADEDVVDFGALGLAFVGRHDPPKKPPRLKVSVSAVKVMCLDVLKPMPEPESPSYPHLGVTA